MMDSVTISPKKFSRLSVMGKFDKMSPKKITRYGGSSKDHTYSSKIKNDEKKIREQKKTQEKKYRKSDGMRKMFENNEIVSDNFRDDMIEMDNFYEKFMSHEKYNPFDYSRPMLKM
jgi:hypothetical protein